ncbi:DUF1846 domain-containing protein [Catenisphaera adipataccumulans]|jgi:uncharacterized protein (UPF0371 family)|uniref:Uncharacterized protein (UPF0371 family) n=1 Tax=Catenisphaera adipataccumulans TaxID=700500 RepID=A0A7W8CWT6_9FIRM|nr:DUF1846 domain-containing protein [Catenisphaera adipataccumulans]MBB5182429.1 uncharacterized protein (UPF0371 family) [Catenisphaera adipataccumulans]
MKIGFDNNKYLKMQAEHIRKRIAQFDDKLYLEFGGKLFDDYHASRVLPGFSPDSKLQMLISLKDKAEIIIAICAKDITTDKRRGDLGITYDQDVFRLVKEFQKRGLYVSSIVVTQYEKQAAVERFCSKARRRHLKVYKHYQIDGYPTNTKKIISDEGFGKNDFVQTSRPLVIVTAPGPGSGKMATCLSQLYHENKRGIRAGYAKFETFPIWNIPLDHPVNLAYEAATADLNDINMIDPFHLNAYGKITVNYNRDVEIFPVLKKMFEGIFGTAIYQSPTDMGVNMAGFCISDDAVCRDAGNQEIIRRYYDSRTRFIREECSEAEVQKQELIMEKAKITPDDRPCVVAAHEREEASKTYAGAIELADGTIVTGKTSKYIGACSGTLINALKQLAGIDQETDVIENNAFAPIQNLKTEYLGSHNPRLHSDEILIALALSARTSENAAHALEKLPELRGCQAHITCDISQVDLSIYKQLGLQVTYEAEKK